jgi:hypothetical protein
MDCDETKIFMIGVWLTPKLSGARPRCPNRS